MNKTYKCKVVLTFEFETEVEASDAEAALDKAEAKAVESKDGSHVVCSWIVLPDDVVSKANA